MESVFWAILSLSNIVCFVIGARVGQKVVRGEPIEVKNPVAAYREHKQMKKAEEEQSRLDIILENLETYNGTSVGQKDVPKGDR